MTSRRLPQQAADRRSVTIPYGQETLRFAVPAANLWDVLTPNAVDIPADGDAVLADAIANPIGSPPLEALARGRRDAVIIIDDMTRPTPVSRVLPHLLNELNRAGLSDGQIKVVVALGTHRNMATAEIAQRVGCAVVQRVRVVNSHYADPAQLKDCGLAADGTRLWVDRQVMDADLRIAVGTILPHPVAGWGGGAKIIYPGVGGAETVARFHMQQALLTENIFGQVSSPIRANMERWVGRLGLHFIVNVVCMPHGDIYRAVAGHFVQAHRQGVRFAQDVIAVRARSRADIVVASSFPADLDFWQAGKGMMSADLLARDGAIIVLATPCPEGIGPHAELADFMASDDPNDLARRTFAGEYSDAVVAAASVTLARMRLRCRYAIVSDGLDAATCARMKVRHFEAVQAAVDWALAESGPAARLSVIPYGAETVPLLPDTEAPSAQEDAA